MFNMNQDKGELVGAKEKRDRAKALKAGSGEIKSKREGKGGDNTTISVLIIYLFSCALAYFLTAGPWKDGVRVNTGHDGIDDLMFSSSLHVMGDPALDMILQVMARGLMIFILAGLLPLSALIWIRALDRADMNPDRTRWGVPIGIGVVYCVIADIIVPLVQTMM